MGLFDEIEVDHPSLASEPRWFQTKTFDCMMETYRITKAGDLEFQEYEIQDLGDKNAPENSLDRIYGSTAHVPTGQWRNVSWCGFVEFHNSDERYVAKFTDGKLVEIKAVPLEAA